MTGTIGEDRRHQLESLAVTLLTGASGEGSQGEPGRAREFDRASFIRLGGDSLQAMALVALAREHAGITLDMSALLGDSPLGSVLSQALATPDTAGEPQAAPRDPAAARAAAAGSTSSAVQQGIWMREQIIGPLPYNLVFTALIDGPLNGELLTAALNECAGYHAGLRTVFIAVEGKLERRVLESHAYWIRRLGYPAGEGDFAGHARTMAAAIGREPFDLGGAPPLRFVLTSSGPDRHALIMVVHHLALDGWAIGLLLRELFARYDALSGGPPLSEPGPAVRFEEQLDWLEGLSRSGEIDRQARFWREHLADAPAVLELPSDCPRPAVQDPHGSRRPFALSAAQSAAVREQARRLGITSTAFLLAAFALTVSRHTGARSLLIGTPVLGRPTPRLGRLMAATANLVPVRVQVDDDATIGAFLTGVQEAIARSLAHAVLPLADIAAERGLSGTIERHPLIQVAFGVHAGLVPERLSTASLTVRIEEGHGGGAQFDLQLLIGRDSPSFAGTLEYATSVWQEADAAGFGADLEAAVAGLMASPSVPLEGVRCLAAGHRDRLNRLNDTSLPYPVVMLDEEFRAQVRRTPGRVAVRAADGAALTYAELERAASAQARLLADAGVRPGSTVLVTTGRSIAEAVAVLGAVWAGAAYAGVEPGTPPGRVAQIVSVLEPAAEIGDGIAARLGVPRVPSWPALPPQTFPPVPPDQDRVAYVAFTSGSTGTPKGVCVTHRGIANLMAGLPDYAPVGPGDRVLRFCSLAFDVSTFELWGSLLNGAALEICPAGVPSPADLGRFIHDARITVAWLTAGLFSVVAEHALDHLGGVRYLVTGGDVISPRDVRDVTRRHPGLTVVCAYGPAENTTFSTAHPVTVSDAVEDPLPIGTPVANIQVYVLDDRRRLVPPGAIGELYLAGDGLAAGYLGAEELTRRSFGELSPDVPHRLYRTGDIVRLDSRGRLRFVGRRDDQVKIRGCRVELGDVRSALLDHPDVADAFVTVSGDGNARQLVAACIPRADGLTAAELASFLAQRRPGYMLPALWAFLPALPLTVTGKIDRDLVRRSARPLAAYDPPR